MLTPKEQKRLRKCESELAMPKWKYILIYGLTFGVMAFIFSTLWDLIIDGKSIQWNLGLLASFLIRLVVGGITFGWILRIFVMREYKKLKAKAD
jgi:hypothetical protein